MKDPGNSLEAHLGDEVVFSSRSHWLHPLLELEDYLASSPVDPAALVVHDTKSGRAAAGLVVRLGIRRLVVGLASDYALEFLMSHGVEVEWRKRVPRLDCATEDLITPAMGPEEIHSLVLERVARGGRNLDERAKNH